MADKRRANGSPAPEVIARLADDVLPTLIARLDRSRLGELEVRQNGWRVRLRRAAVTAPDGADTPAAPTRRDRRADRAHLERGDGSADGGPQQLRPADRGQLEVTSPAVGYYLPRDGLAVGMPARAGDVLGHIDVLGIRQDVVAPGDGLVAALEAQSGEAVEYGQPLARLERSRPAAGGEAGS